MELLDNIREICLRKKVRLEDVAVAIGSNPKSIYRWNTSLPSVDKAVAAADYLGVSIDEVVGRTKKESNDQEREVLFLFRKMSKEGQDAALAMLFGLSMQYKKDSNSASA